MHRCGIHRGATYVVKFEQRPKRVPERKQSIPAGRVPRIARLLALAYRIDGMIRSGEMRDWADSARLLGITRARMTQISNLLLLAPDIQKAILDLPPVTNGRDRVNERDLRRILGIMDWAEQHRMWAEITTTSPESSTAWVLARHHHSLAVCEASRHISVSPA